MQEDRSLFQRHPLSVVIVWAALVAIVIAATFVTIVRPTQAAGSEEAKAASGNAATSADVERGRYLVAAMGCNDCHTPWKMGANGPEPDMSRMLSGHPQDLVMPAAPAVEGPWGFVGAGTMTAWAGPWGVSFTANLTPDEETGLGRWTEADLVATMRSGRHLGRGRPLLPPMPYFNVAALTDEDIHALWAYLQSIPPIANRVPEPVPPAGS